MILKIENLTKKIDDNIILDDININFKEGFIYGIIGKNGSGKSMLLKTICGFLTPTSGNVFVDDLDIYKNTKIIPNARALIGNPEYLPDYSGTENLKFLADIQKKIGDKEIKETIDIVNLSKDANKKMKKYSLGMKQKVGIAQVLMENPKIMIFDEPFNGLDEESIIKIREHLKKIKKDKIIIIATHYKEDIEKLIDVTIKISNGKIE
ncbi:MAG: ABC transporter ATP-binding protein [Bacilli bacterium]